MADHDDLRSDLNAFVPGMLNALTVGFDLNLEHRGSLESLVEAVGMYLLPSGEQDVPEIEGRIIRYRDLFTGQKFDATLPVIEPLVMPHESYIRSNGDPSSFERVARQLWGTAGAFAFIFGANVEKLTLPHDQLRQFSDEAGVPGDITVLMVKVFGSRILELYAHARRRYQLKQVARSARMGQRQTGTESGLIPKSRLSCQ